MGIEISLVLDLLSCNTPRFIIEDIVYVPVSEFVTIIVDIASGHSKA